MDSLENLKNLVVKFRDDRDWKQFHNPKDLAISLNLEASEVLEHFQWKNKDEIEVHIKEKGEEIAEELSDVLYWVLLMANDMDIDLEKSFKQKLIKNDLKYPAEKAKGTHTKYTEL